MATVLLKRSEEIETAGLSEKAHRLIPAGCHTYSKGDDQFPASAPRFLARGEGCRVWDPEGREYLDWGMGLRSVILGHAYPRVVQAAAEQLHLGSNFVRPSPIETELAELLVDTVPAGEMVKFAKNGSDVTSAAVRLARAYTGRDLVVVCQDNPFYSFDDWFIGATVCNSGIPKAVSDLTLKFSYGDIEGLEALFEQYPGRIACVMIEPAATAPLSKENGCGQNDHLRVFPPSSPVYKDCWNATFLRKAREVAHRYGALLVFDEMITGFRWDVPGAQTFYGVEPDLSCFGKGMGNGFSVAALVGRQEVMELGGIRHTDREKVFLLSSTHGGETHAIAAAIATIHEMREEPVIEHIWRIGAALKQGLNKAAQETGLEHNIRCEGYPCSPIPSFIGDDGRPSAELRTLFLQELVDQGILIPYIAVSYSHTMKEVEQTVEAFRKALGVCKVALDRGFGSGLIGSSVKPVFRKFN